VVSRRVLPSRYVPSISLIDDVFRLKKDALLVSGFVASVFWVVFATLMSSPAARRLAPQPPAPACAPVDSASTRLDSLTTALGTSPNATARRRTG
jgi:hypothetical protein